ncbi:MAG: hypothetical protein ACRDRI_24180 [Pseudonocardiaceae bacterium]
MKGTTATEGCKACLEGVALLGEHDLDGAAAVLEPLLDSQDSPCRVEAAFLLGVVRLAQSVSVVVRRRAAADAFAIAAEGGNPVYSPAAAYRYATLLDTSDQEQLRACWQRVVDTGSRVYSPVAHYVIAQTWRRAGRDDEAEKSMIRAWGSMDPEYGPKAAVWLTEHAARAGKWDLVTRIGSMANFDYGPFFMHNEFEQGQQFAALWRYQLLDNMNPVTVLRATHAIAQFDGVTQTPSLQTLLRDHLAAQPDHPDAADSVETPDPVEAPEVLETRLSLEVPGESEVPGGSEDPETLEIPASEAHLWWRPWWIATVAGHQERGTLPELTHDLFWLIDRFYARVAWPYAENDVEDPLNLVRNLMHAVDDFRWGPLLQESMRQRMNAIMGFEVLPPDWPHHDQPDDPGQPDDEEAQS